jgi:hypothetical protein
MSNISKRAGDTLLKSVQDCRFLSLRLKFNGKPACIDRSVSSFVSLQKHGASGADNKWFAKGCELC